MHWLLILLVAAAPPVSTDEPKDNSTEKDWEVHVEFSAITLPKKHALPLLDELNDEAKAVDAFQKVRERVRKGEANQVGTQQIATEHGVRALAQAAEEHRYPIEFEVPTYPDLESRSQLTRAAKHTKTVALTPATFDSRNLGLTLEGTPEVSKDGRWMRFQATASHVRLLGNDEFAAGITPQGLRIVAAQPRFLTMQNAGTFFLWKDVTVLAGVHFPPDQKGQVELFFLRGWTKRKPTTERK